MQPSADVTPRFVVVEPKGHTVHGAVPVLEKVPTGHCCSSATMLSCGCVLLSLLLLFAKPGRSTACQTKRSRWEVWSASAACQDHLEAPDGAASQYCLASVDVSML